MDQNEASEVVSNGVRMETEHPSVSYPQMNVQIQSSWSEIQQRMKIFCAGKRREIDAQNIREYCNKEPVAENHAFSDPINSCARVDAAFIPHRLKRNFVKGSRRGSSWTAYPCENSSMKPAAEKINTCDTGNMGIVCMEGVEERINNMELRLKIKCKHDIRGDPFERLNEIEERCLELEGFSPEYFVPTHELKDGVRETEDKLEVVTNKVLIQADSDEMQRRVAAVMAKGKRSKIRMNVEKYCQHKFLEEDNPLWDQRTTCARVDAVFNPCRRSWRKLAVKPYSQMFQMSDIEDVNEETKNIKNDGRLENICKTPNYKLDQLSRKKVFSKMKELEDKILYLENQSPNYFNFLKEKYKCMPDEVTSEGKLQYTNCTAEDLQQRIYHLEEKLRRKNN